MPSVRVERTVVIAVLGASLSFIARYESRKEKEIDSNRPSKTTVSFDPVVEIGFKSKIHLITFQRTTKSTSLELQRRNRLV